MTVRPLSAILTVAVLAAGTGSSLAQSTTAQPVASAGSPAAAPAAPSLEQFFRIRAPGVPALLPDGSLLLRDWPDGVWQVYHLTPAKDTAAPGGLNYQPGKATATKVTSYPDGVADITVSPDGTVAVLMHSVGGNENTQLTRMDLAGLGASGGVAPALKPILANAKAQASVNCWLPDSRGFIYSANADSPTDFHLYLHDLKTGATTRILAQEGSWSARDITADGTRAIVQRYFSESSSIVYELDVKTGSLTDISIKPERGTAACQPIGYMPGDKAVLMTSDYKDGLSRLFARDLATGTVTEPIPALSKFELDGAGMNNEKTLIAVAVNEDGYGTPRIYSLPTFAALPLPKADKGVIASAGFRGRTLVWANNNARDPGASYATTWPEGQGEPTTRQITHVDTRGIDLASFPLPDLIKFKAFDGTEIPAFLFLPPNYSNGKAIPFVIVYHGGPESQHRPIFSATQQYLLSRGFGIMLPNVRGSTGYGRAFHMMDDYKKRWDSVRDGVDAAEWLVNSGYSAPGKISTLGGSYGGFMSVACLIEDQERVAAGKRPAALFGAGINLVGIVNFKTFLEKTAGYRRKLREAEYGPLADPDFLASVSSMSKIDKVKSPVFIAHGFNDPRVPVEEAMQLSVALKDRGIPVQLFVAPDEGHGFQKLQNRLYFYERVSAFLKDTIAK